MARHAELTHAPRAPRGGDGRAMSMRARAALAALCRRIAPVDDVQATALAAHVAARLDAGDPLLRARVRVLLSLFESAVIGALSGGVPRPFSRLSPEAQDARLRAWEVSRIPLRRTIFQAFRRLILSTWYALPEAQRAVGYLGPLHARGPVLAWEGPLPGVPDDAEPVARGARELPPTGDARWREANRVPNGVTIGREIATDTVLRAEVCVVGTGAGGGVAAARLAEAGRDVVILEEGGYYTAADFSEDEAEMVPRLYAEQGARATEDLGVSMLQGRSVGGGTTVNWMIMLRPPEWVLDEWAREHGLGGLGAADLAPVLERVEGETHTRLVPEDAHSPNNRIILDGARALGWRAWGGAVNARDCVRAGFCGIGCRYGAKQSTLVTYIPRALAAGARLLADVRVERVEVAGRGGRAPLKRVHCVVLDRESGVPRGRVTVEAPVVVLAAGAVGTPAILQRSAMGGGAVGRFLRLHPTSAVIGVYDRDIYGAAGIPLSAVCDEFLRGERGYGFWLECPPLLPALASVAVPGFGAAHRALLERFPRLGATIVLVRDGADRALSNGDVRVDRAGRPRIRYRLGPTDGRHLREGLRAAARLHLAAGAREAVTLHAPPRRARGAGDLDAIAQAPVAANRVGLFSAHVNGTCRLGTDPRTSGCNPDGERHGVRGLYVADGSLLPTALGVNPQETIMALSTVVAERIAAGWGGRV